MQLQYDFEASGRIDFSSFKFAERMQQGDVTTGVHRDLIF